MEDISPTMEDISSTMEDLLSTPKDLFSTPEDLLSIMEVARKVAAKHQQLEVIALISGGKDSFFSLLHCLANGHKVVALANLYPPTTVGASEDQDDLNSYMYQTAGHALIPLYAAALGLPLYRQEIVGGPTNTSKDYHYMLNTTTSSINTTTGGKAQELDETESLLALLCKVLQTHPAANAVCSGAILSTYQRTRIESVARRLKLTSLSYLWQYPLLPPSSPGGLLDDMAAVGLFIVIVKVASGGLDEDLLGKELLDPAVRRTIEKSVAKFGGNLLGEGGEYETMVLYGPAGVFKGSIRMGQSSVGWIGRGEGGEAWVGYEEGAGEVVMKDNDASLDVSRWKRRLRLPDIWDPEFKALLGRMLGSLRTYTVEFDIRRGRQPSGYCPWVATKRIHKSEMTMTISNITGVDSGNTAGEQMTGIKSKLLNVLETDPDPDSNKIIFTTILLRSMTDFAAVNQMYGQLFAFPNPPARVTVACGRALPPRVEVMVSVVIDLGIPRAREGLHVQSRSYWAPANIGPYSQAISVPKGKMNETSLVYVAGQIPLVPASMQKLASEAHEWQWDLFQRQACLSLQHLWRIGKAMSVSWWTGAVAFISGKGNLQLEAKIAWETWRHVHDRRMWEKDEEEDDGLDVWDHKYGGMGSLVQEHAKPRPLPDFEGLSNHTGPKVPPFLAVQVDDLPRGCKIEWQSLGVTRPIVDLVACTEIGLNTSDREVRIKVLELLQCMKTGEDAHVTVYTCRPATLCDLNVQIIPCTALWGQEGVCLAAGAIIQHEIKA